MTRLTRVALVASIFALVACHDGGTEPHAAPLPAECSTAGANCWTFQGDGLPVSSFGVYLHVRPDSQIDGFWTGVQSGTDSIRTGIVTVGDSRQITPTALTFRIASDNACCFSITVTGSTAGDRLQGQAAAIVNGKQGTAIGVTLARVK